MPNLKRQYCNEPEGLFERATDRLGRRGRVQPGPHARKARAGPQGRLGQQHRHRHRRDRPSERLEHEDGLRAAAERTHQVAVPVPHEPGVRNGLPARGGDRPHADVPHERSRGRGEVPGRAARRAAHRVHRSQRLHPACRRRHADAHVVHLGTRLLQGVLRGMRPRAPLLHRRRPPAAPPRGSLRRRAHRDLRRRGEPARRPGRYLRRPCKERHRPFAARLSQRPRHHVAREARRLRHARRVLRGERQVRAVPVRGDAVQAHRLRRPLRRPRLEGIRMERTA